MLSIPEFEDGKTVLGEQHLYALARLSIECLRLAVVGHGRHGLFAPASALQLKQQRKHWNHAEPRGEQLHLHDLHLYGDEGHPFILEGDTIIPLAGSRLFVALTIPETHAAHVAPRGYGLDFLWDEPSKAGSRPVVELGEVKRSAEGLRFEFKPPALTLGSTSVLSEAGSELREAANQFRSVLIDHGQESAVPRNVLLDRINRLVLTFDDTSLNSLASEAKLLLDVAVGFLLRVEHTEAPPGDTYHPGGNMADPALERYLHERYASLLDRVIPPRMQELARTADDLVRAPCRGPSAPTAERQLSLIRGLTDLLRTDGVLEGRLRASGRAVPVSPGFPVPSAIGKQLFRFDWEAKAGATGETTVTIQLNRGAKDIGYSFDVEGRDMSVLRLPPPAAGAGLRFSVKGAGTCLLLSVPDNIFPQVIVE